MAEVGPDERTVEKLAVRAGLSAQDILSTLRNLEALDPPLVERERDATLEVEVWIALEAAIAALEGAEGWEAL